MDFDTLAESYGVEKIKTLGDCYMACCGAGRLPCGARASGPAAAAHPGSYVPTIEPVRANDTGVPEPLADHARRVCFMALDMAESLQATAEGGLRDADENADQGAGANARPRLRMRIGIHSGSVVAGVIGVRKFKYGQGPPVRGEGGTPRTNKASPPSPVLMWRCAVCRVALVHGRRGRADVWSDDVDIASLMEQTGTPGRPAPAGQTHGPPQQPG